MAAEQTNSWAELLSKAANHKKEEGFTLVVLGDAGSGKSELLRRFRDRQHNERSNEYLLDYSYLDVKNVYDEQDADEVRARGRVVEMNHPEQAAALLPFFLRGAGLGAVAYVVCLDLSRPWALQRALDRWLAVLNAAHAEVFGELPEEQQRALMERVSRYNQFYVDPSVAASAEDGAADGAAAAAAAAARGSVSAMQDVPVDTTQPPRNLGVPLVLVGCKADALAGVFAQQSGVGDRFEFLSSRLRSAALEYGAALVFTSAQGKEGVNVAALQEYIYHRVYGFQHARPAAAVGSDVDIGLYVPSGYDSADLIASVQPARASWDADAGFDAVFRAPPAEAAAEAAAARRSATAESFAEEEVKAEPNEVFFKTLKFNMQNKQPQPVRLASAAPGAAAGASSPTDERKTGGASKTHTRAGAARSRAGEDDGAVKSFFKNLLANKSGGAGGKQNVEAVLSSWKNDKK